MNKEKIGDTILLTLTALCLILFIFNAISQKKEEERLEAERIQRIQELEEMARIDSHEYVKMLEKECEVYEINIDYVIAHSRVMTEDFTNDYCLVNHNFGTNEYERVFTDAEEGIRIYVNWFFINNKYLWEYDLERISASMKQSQYKEKMEELLND